MIRPARSHPRAVVTAVAARDKEKAKAYAKEHLIPLVLDSYAGELVYSESGEKIC